MTGMSHAATGRIGAGAVSAGVANGVANGVGRGIGHGVGRGAAHRAGAFAALVTAASSYLVAAGAQGAVIAAWNLNGVDPLQTTVFAATTGAGTLDFSGLGASASALQGTALGAQKGELAGESLAVVGTLGNGTSMRLDFETFGYRDLTLSFATRRSATGASANRIEYWSGFTWLTAAEFTSNATAWEVVTVKLAAQDFLEKIWPMSEVSSALDAQKEAIATFYEMVSAGRPFLELSQWFDALAGKLLFSDVMIDGYVVRLTQPQARAAFVASAASPTEGLTPEELPVCIARTACDKYKGVTPMGPGAKVTGFLANLLGEDDEEDVVLAATGGQALAPPPAKKESSQAKAAPEEEAYEEEEPYDENEDAYDDEGSSAPKGGSGRSVQEEYEEGYDEEEPYEEESKSKTPTPERPTGQTDKSRGKRARAGGSDGNGREALSQIEELLPQLSLEHKKELQERIAELIEMHELRSMINQR